MNFIGKSREQIEQVTRNKTRIKHSLRVLSYGLKLELQGINLPDKRIANFLDRNHI